MNASLTRRRFATLALSAMLAPSLLIAADDKKDAAKTDRELLAGTWICARVGANGVEKKPADGDSITVTIENEQFKAIVVRDGDSLEVVGSYSLVDKETPKLIDLVVQNGDVAMSVYCLYELEEKVFKLRFNAATGERPADFTVPGEGLTTLIFHRKK